MGGWIDLYPIDQPTNRGGIETLNCIPGSLKLVNRRLVSCLRLVLYFNIPSLLLRGIIIIYLTNYKVQRVYFTLRVNYKMSRIVATFQI